MSSPCCALPAGADLGPAHRRGGVDLAGAARARRADGRYYVIPDDVKALAPAVLRHRIALSPACRDRGTAVESVIARLIDQVGAPR